MCPSNETLPKMTYQLVICDDEPYIATSTAALLQMKLAFETDIQVFRSSREAHAYIKEHRIDLLISNIRMQQMDGLELMHETLRLWPASQCILLTAYTDFDYVYDAISHTGVSYVLKCDGHDALLNAVEKSLNRLETALRQEKFTRRARCQMASALPLLRREWFLDLSAGVDQESSEAFRQELSLPIAFSKPFSAFLILVQLYGSHTSFMEQLTRLELLSDLSSQLFSEDMARVFIPLDRQSILCLLQEKEQGSLSAGRLEGMLEGLQRAAAQNGIPLGIVYLPHIPDLNALSQSYEALLHTQSALAGVQDGPWLMQAQKAVCHSAVLDGRYIARVRSWRMAFENGDPSADGLLNELLSPLEAPGLSWNEILVEMYMQLALQIVSLLRGNGDIDIQRSGLSLMQLMSAERHAGVVEAAAYLRRTVAAIRQQQQTSVNSTAAETVRRVKAYVSAHLHEDISITCLADSIGLNASYLSRLFRKTTGETLISYIANARRELACSLLMDPHRQIQQISQELGFLTPAYFSYFFKKNEGLTPTEYRERHTGEAKE